MRRCVGLRVAVGAATSAMVVAIESRLVQADATIAAVNVASPLVVHWDAASFEAVACGPYDDSA